MSRTYLVPVIAVITLMITVFARADMARAQLPPGWTELPHDLQNYAGAGGVHPVDESVVWVIGDWATGLERYPIRTTNGGVTWV